MNARRTAFLRRLAGAVCPPKLRGTMDGALWADGVLGILKRAWSKLDHRERGRADARWAHRVVSEAFTRRKR